MSECDKRPAEHQVMSSRHKEKGKKGQHHNCSCSIIISIIDTCHVMFYHQNAVLWFLDCTFFMDHTFSAGNN